MDKLDKPLEGEIRFPKIEVPISDEDLFELRKYILEVSSAYYTDEILQQLNVDFDPSPLNRYIKIDFSKNQAVNPYAVSFALEQGNLKSNLNIPFFELIVIAHDVNDRLDEIRSYSDEGAHKFLDDSSELFDNDPILQSLESELKKLIGRLNDPEFKKNIPKFLALNEDIHSFERAILIQRAVLIVINYSS